MRNMTPGLVAALKNYFDTKARNNGFFATTEEKQSCISCIEQELEKLGVYGYVFPGLVEIHWGNDIITYHNAKNYEIGTSDINAL